VSDENDEIVGGDWLGTPDAANYLGLRAPTLYRLIDEGLLPAYRMGRVIRIKLSDLDRFIASSRIEPGKLSHLHSLRDLDETG
jgi:excisionase family DNA binding protein